MIGSEYLDIVQIQCYDLLSTFPGVPDHIRMNWMNQLNAFMYALSYATALQPHQVVPISRQSHKNKK